MNQISNSSRIPVWQAIAYYCATVLLSALIAIFALKLWDADLRVPFNYSPHGQDAFFNMMLVKTVIETGWTAHNPLLGAPAILNQLDFPNPESLHAAAYFVLSLFTHNFGVVLNLYYLLTFPLTALCATVSARQLGLSRPAAQLVAQLFTFLPFHFMRGEMHMALAAYYAVPLTIPSIVAIARGVPMTKPERLTAFIGYVMTAFSGAYYAIFAGFFLMIAAMAGRVGRRDANALRSACPLAAVLGAAFVVQLIPNIIHSHLAGPNPTVGARVLYEGDLYGLRLTQMLLPVPGHRIAAMAEFRDQYATHAPLVNENESSALGIIGSVGLLFLLFQMLFRSAQVSDGGKINALAMLLFAGILLATVGGFGPTMNYLGYTTLRGYNRISIFLGFFSLVAVGLLIDRLTVAHKTRAAICGVILVLGLLDQISPRFVPAYAQNQRDFLSDAKFVAAIEATVPARAAIFELPVMPYPESAPINDLGDYELFRGYLHSSSLRWSYGAMKGREASAWQSAVVKKPWPEALAEIKMKGFAGIYLDRRAFDNDSTETTLRSLLGPPIASNDGRIIFFSMSNLRPSPATLRRGE